MLLARNPFFAALKKNLAFYKRSASASSSVIRHPLTSKKYIPSDVHIIFHCLSYLFRLRFLRPSYTSGRAFYFVIHSVA